MEQSGYSTKKQETLQTPGGLLTNHERSLTSRSGLH